MLARTDSRARALFLLVVLAIVAGVIGGRLAWWHVVEHDRLSAMAAEQLAQNQAIPAERGVIRDARGQLLATSIQVFSVYATPPDVTDPESEAEMLAGVLNLSREDLLARLSGGKAWIWLQRRVDPAVSNRIRMLDLPGIGLIPETKRVYPTAGAAPGSTLAAQLVGYVNLDGTGQYGVEGAENRLLAGRAGHIVAEEDVAGRQIADSVQLDVNPVDGADLTLTIDSGVQQLLESQLYDTYLKNHAHGATGIVMNVHTGAILGMASFPTFNGNDYGATNPALFDNPAVADPYEPGSVMKAFTLAAAFDAGAITTDTKVLDNNNLTISGVRIQNADRFDHPWGHGKITPQQVLQLSNNNGAARIGLKLGGEKLYQAFRRFGFGQPTGIDLYGEVGGTIWDPASANASGNLTTAQNAFGQGLTVTAAQLVAGYAAIANGGTMVTPHVVAGWTDGSGTYHATPLPNGERVMRPETSATVMRLLLGAIDGGIAHGASVPGYSIAGKTGTAEIAGPVKVRDANGNIVTRMQYKAGWIDSSFIGVYPASDPQLVTLILIHRPATWGRYLVVQRPENVFHQLAPKILDYLGIPPDRRATTVAAVATH
jgi:cell division protein FtsI (penicillin-binding protein 3)